MRVTELSLSVVWGEVLRSGPRSCLTMHLCIICLPFVLVEYVEWRWRWYYRCIDVYINDGQWMMHNDLQRLSERRRLDWCQGSTCQSMITVRRSPDAKSSMKYQYQALSAGFDAQL